MAAANGDDIKRIRDSKFFDEKWYLEQYPDVKALGMDPVEHYLWLGAAMGRKPGPLFDTGLYLDENKDVAGSGLNPLLHYLLWGKDEGRRVTKSPSATRKSNYPLQSIGPLTLATCPASKSALASLVIPVHGKHEYTFNALSSLSQTTDLHDIEIIIVDDLSPTPVTRALGEVEGIHVFRPAENLGFLRSCNLGVGYASGRYIAILNNDVTFTPGWLDAMIDTFSLRPDAGLVGAKLVYPDGRLQEAGGIVWRDGSAWNWGRGRDPDHPTYNYVREADYCSGACLMLRKEDWQRLGGFDETFAPGYYEDTDLAFRVRAAGKRVYYQPKAVIVHYEGISHGTDVAHGVKRHQLVNQAAFLQRWEKTLASHRVNGAEPEREADRYRTKRVLVVEARMIMPDQDSGSVRTEAMLQLMVELGFNVEFASSNPRHQPRYAERLQQAGVQVWHEPYLQSVFELVQERGKLYDAIVLCRHYIAARYIDAVRQWAPQAKVIFDTVDLHYLREQRRAELERAEDLRASALKTRAQELDVIRKSDLTFVVSPVERDELSKAVPEARVEILSNIHKLRTGQTPSYGQRRGLLFVGGFEHPPNVDAVQWFVGEVWPLVRRSLPEVTFDVIGSKMPESLRSHEGDGVKMHGFVEELRPFLESCRISVAPLRYGAGVKGKVNQAMAWGVPVVATSAAVEGMALTDGVDVLVADEAADFARQVVRLYQSQPLWEQLAEGGRDNIRLRFSREVALAALRRVLA